jgi:Glycosyl transferase 4-like domain
LEYTKRIFARRNVIRRVLIVSPHFPPINAADHQRVRMSLPYFQEFGWEPWILTVEPECVEGVDDPLLIKTVPDAVRIQTTPALPVNLTRQIGLGTLGWRCLPYFAHWGDRLLATQSFDLVYFSTTVFLTMALGAYWKRRFGIPYVLDFQDPWVGNYYQRSPNVPPPGGRLKYSFNQWIARQLEPQAMRQVNQVISVSPEYPKMLRDRYPWLHDDQFTVLPFGAPEADFKLLPSLQVQQSIFDAQDGNQHWVYVGRGGGDVALALRTLFLAIRTDRDRHPESWKTIKLHFIGTSYAPKGRAIKTVEPIAQEFGIADLVTEQTDRIPYFEALQVLVDSDAILMIGSDDPGYTASKLYPCILARKPILAIFHQQSSVVEILQQCQAGRSVTFSSTSQPQDLLPETIAQLHWLRSLPKGYQPETNWTAFQPYTAREMTRKQCAVFDRCLPHSENMA